MLIQFENEKKELIANYEKVVSDARRDLEVKQQEIAQLQNDLDSFKQ